MGGLEEQCMSQEQPERERGPPAERTITPMAMSGGQKTDRDEKVAVGERCAFLLGSWFPPVEGGSPTLSDGTPTADRSVQHHTRTPDLGPAPTPRTQKSFRHLPPPATSAGKSGASSGCCDACATSN